jgi:hypothetical protein
MMSRLSLENLAEKIGCDKFSHGYCPTYEKYLNKFRDTPIRILEIGVLNGHSLMLWKEYFSNAEIHGIDINNCPHPEGTTLHILNMNNIEGIQEFVEKNGKWDIIIDDGKHSMSTQQNALTYLWKTLKNKGVFIMEDIHSSFMLSMPYIDMFELYNLKYTTYNMITNLKNKEPFVSPYMSKKTYDFISSEVDTVEIFQRLPDLWTDSITSVIVKK